MTSSTVRAADGIERAVSFARRLRDAHGFIEVGLATCAAAREQALDCAIALLSSSGQPLIAVEHVVTVEKMFSRSLPITALTEHIGVIRWSAAQQVDDPDGELATIAMHVAVRLAQLGYTSCLDAVDPLTPRQVETASLAARGHTNAEIAEHLGVSENTIKKHIGEVFERLHIANRTELALRFSRLATIDLGPAGVSYVGDCRIVRVLRTPLR